MLACRVDRSRRPGLPAPMKTSPAIAWGRALSIVACLLGTLPAQDVTVAPLQWMEPQDAPDQLVVLPRMVSASAPAFGYAAVQTVATWRFEPPTSGGKPVMARARVPFTFKASAPRESESGLTDGK